MASVVDWVFQDLGSDSRLGPKKLEPEHLMHSENRIKNWLQD